MTPHEEDLLDLFIESIEETKRSVIANNVFTDSEKEGVTIDVLREIGLI